MLGIKAIVFDVFGSVVNWRDGVAREVAPFLHRHNRADIDPLLFADAWRSRYQPSMEQVRSGQREFVSLDVLHRENLDATLLDFDIDPTSIDTLELDDLNLAWHRLDPWPDAVDVLTRLKQRYIIAPLSNGNIRLMVDIARHGGLPWDAILGAEVARAYKPSPEAYLRTAGILGLRPDQMCMAAAHNTDLAAARACGFKTAFFPRPFEHGTDQKTDLRPEQDWDVIAQDLRHLAAQLCP